MTRVDDGNSHRHRPIRIHGMLGGLVALAITLGFLLMYPATVAAAAPVGLFNGSKPTDFETVTGDSPVELGVRFTPRAGGSISAIRVYKAHPASSDTAQSGSLWDANGTRLAQVAINPTASTGWQTIALPKPVALRAGTTYTASIYQRAGAYIATRGAFRSATATPDFTIPEQGGVYRYAWSSQFPKDVYRSSNYWIDVVYAVSGQSGSTPTTSVTPSLTPRPSPTATTTQPRPSPTATSTRPTASPTSTATPPTSPSPSASSTRPSPSSTPTPTTSTPTTSGLMGWQLTARNVGLAPFGLTCSSLPRYTGSLQPTAGTRISGVRIDGNMDLRAGDIVIERSCIRPAVGNSGSLITNYVCGADDCPVISDKSVTIRDSEFDASGVPASQIAGSCAFRGTGTLARNYIHGMGSGICFYGTGLKHDAIATQNYVTELRSYGDSHNEAATIRDFMRDQNPNRVARFVANRFDIAEGNVTAGLFIQPTWDDIDDLLVQDNLIEGGGYNLFLNASHGTYNNVRAINNRFRSTGWGPTTVQGGPGWAQWSENYRYDPSRADAKGAIVQQS